ncbi:MAG: outer membrane beta-barrel protein [Ignavibacteria bacterium]|jgi:opacity protein-like surface antigen
MKLQLMMAALLVSIVSAQAQRGLAGSDELRVGIVSTFDQRFLTASFAQLPSVPTCCQSFGNEQHNGYTIGALAELPLSVGLAPTLRVLYTQLGGEFTSTDEKYVFDGSLASAQASFLHTIDARIHAIVIEPGMRITTDGGFNIGLGVQLGYLADATFTQREEIASPSTITYKDGSRERNIQTGDLPQLNDWQIGLNLGAGYDFHFTDAPDLVIGPEVNYTYNFSNIIDGINWKTHTLRVGIVAKWIFNINSTIAP